MTPKWRICRADRVVQALSALRSRRQMSLHVMADQQICLAKGFNSGSRISQRWNVRSSSFTPPRAIEPPTTSMFPQRNVLRASQRFAAQLRSPAIRTPFQRRFASTESSAFHGAEDNAFNRERKAVKDHAAATSGMLPAPREEGI